MTVSMVMAYLFLSFSKACLHGKDVSWNNANKKQEKKAEGCTISNIKKNR